MGRRTKKSYKERRDLGNNGDYLTFSELKESMGPNVKVEYLGKGKVKMTKIEEKVVNRHEISVNLSVESQFIQVYLGFYEKLISSGMFTLPMIILTYVLKYRMSSDNNKFEVNQDFYDSFNEYAEEMTGKPFNQRHLVNTIKEMVTLGIFIRISKGHYQVNPLGFWQGKKSDRADTIFNLAKNNLIDKAVAPREKTERIGKEGEDGIIS